MKTKKSFALIVCLFCLLRMYAQTPNAWVIGSGSSINPYGNNYINFNSLVTQITSLLPNPQNPFYIANANIAKKDSTLLYYSNGIKIFNRLHQMMPGSDTLSPNAFTFMHLNKGSQMPQAVVFIPFPSGESKHYLFHEAWNFNYGGQCPVVASAGGIDAIYYTVINDTLNSGYGGIESKNKLLSADTFGECLLAVKHGNGRDWWLLSHHNINAQWFAWLITPQGIQPPIIQSVGPQVCYGYRSLKFSATANKIAGMRALWDFPLTRYIDLFDFDRCSGLITNHELLTTVNNAQYPFSGGCEVSGSGQYLYVSAMSHLYQFDLLAANIAASVLVVDTVDSLFPASAIRQPWGSPIQLAPDGKIYASCNCSSSNKLSVINNPDLPGIGCNAVHGGISLPNYANSTLPYIPQYELGLLLGSACDTLTALPPQPINTKTLKVYPNPATNVITIVDDVNYLKTVTKIEAINPLGQKQELRFEQKDGITCNVTGLSNGLYYLQLMGSSTKNCLLQIIK